MAERYRDELRGRPSRGRPHRGVRGVAHARPVRVAARASAGALVVRSPPRFRVPLPTAPWAYVKVAEGCDRRCGFCAIPTFRGDQRSRSVDELAGGGGALAEGGAKELVLVAQDLASYGRIDAGRRSDDRRPRHARPSSRSSSSSAASRGTVPWLRLLYLYPSGLTDASHRRGPRDRRAVLRPLAAARLAAAAARDASVG